MNTETARTSANDASRFPDCLICEQAFDVDGEVVWGSEHFVGWVAPVYPWGVILATRRHECDGPWALTDAEAIDMGTTISRMTEAIRKTGSERVYVVQFGEETPVPHLHIALLSRHVPMSEAARAVMERRVQAATDDTVQVATDFAAAVRTNLASTEPANRARHDTSPVHGCTMCEQVFDPGQNVVYDTEHFVGYVSTRYPWAVMLATRRHDCEGPWALTEAEAVDMGKAIASVTAAIHESGSERVYVLQFGDESPTSHLHIALVARYVPLAEAEHDVMHHRVTDATSNPTSTSADAAPHSSTRPSMRDRVAGGGRLAQVATTFAAAIRANL